MFRLLITLSVALMCVAAHAATDPASRVRATAIRAHVSFLADDLLEGRAPGTRGFEIAASYVTAQFRQYGLKPAGSAKSFYQTVPLVEATPVLPGSSATLTRDDGKTEFEYGTHYLPSADFINTHTTLTAPLAFAGYGIEAPELDYDDFSRVDVKGRIAVIFGGAPAKFPNDQRAYYSWPVEKFSTLVRHGAVGAIIIDTPEEEQRSPWALRNSQSWMPQMRWLNAEGQPADVFPELKLRFRFQRDAAAKLFEGSALSLEQATAKAAEGEAQGFELPGSMTLTATTGIRRTESDNVIGVWEGSDPVLKKEYIVVSSHLDHLGRGKSINGDAIYNGAHDNASGVSIMLEIARALAFSGVHARRSIVFAALTAEEKGLLGSEYFAHRPTLPLSRVVANVNIDTPLVLTRTRDLIAIGAEHTTLGPLAAEMAKRYGYRLSSSLAPEEVPFIRSDQFAFIQQGIPSIVLESGNQPRNSKVDLAALKREYLQTHYHQPSDDLLLPLDYDAAADLTRVNLAMIIDIADSDERPRWKKNDFFGTRFPKPAINTPAKPAGSGTPSR